MKDNLVNVVGGVSNILIKFGLAVGGLSNGLCVFDLSKSWFGNRISHSNCMYGTLTTKKFRGTSGMNKFIN